MTQVHPAENSRAARGPSSTSAAKDATARAALLPWVQGMVSAIPNGDPQPGQDTVRLQASNGGPGLRKKGDDRGDVAGLATRIWDAIETDSGTSPVPWNRLDPGSSTPLQQLLDEAVHTLPRSALKASPALLAAVRAGFQTEGGRQFALEANVIEAALVGDLSQPVARAGGVQPRRRLTETDANAEFDATFKPGDQVPLEQWAPVERILRALAENSPDFRNVMARARRFTRGRPLRIVVNPEVRTARLFAQDAVIELNSLANPQQAASGIVFETNNGAQLDNFSQRVLNVRQRAEFTPAQAAQLDVMGARILSGGLRRFPPALLAYVDQEIRRPETLQTLRGYVAEEAAAHPDWTVMRQRQRALTRLRLEIGREALTNPDSLLPYLERTYDTPAKRLDFRAAVEYAHDIEATEMSAAVNHHLIFDNLTAARRTQPLTPDAEALLSEEALVSMDRYREMLHVRLGTPEAFSQAIEVQMRGGHSIIYLEQGLQHRGQPPLVRNTPTGLPPAGTPNVEPDVVIDSLFETTGTDAGLRSRLAVEAAVETHGSTGDTAAARAAVKASLREESLGLAERIVSSPEMAGVVKVLGKAAAAAMVAQLAEAIYTDVSNGDHEAHATRKVLAELAGGLVGGEIGAGLGASAGAAIGSVVPGVGTAVGFFVGGLFGSLAGFAVGAVAGDAAYGLTRKPIDALIDRLIADGGPSPSAGVLGNLLDHPERHAARLITAGSSGDAQVNTGELRKGLQAFGYRLDGNDKALGRLINAYDAGGDGALTAQELAAVIRDKALVVQPDGQVTLDAACHVSRPGEARWRTQAGHIANRWIGLDTARHEGAGDGRINASELADSLHASGYRLAQGTDEVALSRVLNAYDRFGQGAVGQADLTNALSDGALVIDAEGRVSVDGSRIHGLTGGQAANIALRLVQADGQGSDRDGWLNAREVWKCLHAVGYDPRLSEADCKALVARFGADGLIGVKGLQQAIDTGVLALGANGTVTLSPPRPQ